MRIQTNIPALNSWNALSGALRGLEKALRRLSSGERVNTAADDAAGLAIAEKLRSRIRGLHQGTRNAQDGISLIQSAEGALQEVSAILQRARELAVQAANGTLTSADRSSLQQELDQLLAEIDRIADSSSFNGIRLLSASANNQAVTGVLAGLRRSWLTQSEQIIADWYGLTADNTSLSIILETSGARSAWITGSPGALGRLENVQLHINLPEFSPATWPNGGTDPLFDDRLVARALTQAVLARTTNYVVLPDWFISGAADYIAGGDEELAANVARYGGATVVASLGTPWADDSLHRSAAYLAIKYLDSVMQGLGGSIKDFMQMLSASSSLDSTFSTFGLGNTSAFIADFLTNGAAFLSGLNLTDADVGAVQGGDKYTVIPDVDNYSTAPLANFTVVWPSGIAGAAREPLQLQVGAEKGQIIQVELPEITVLSLNLLSVSLTRDPGEAVDLLDAAIQKVAQSRADLGAVQNRLEHTIAVNEVTAENLLASESKIRDADMAEELLYLVRVQILVSSGVAMLAQAHRLPQQVVRMLSALGR